MSGFFIAVLLTAVLILRAQNSSTASQTQSPAETVERVSVASNSSALIPGVSHDDIYVERDAAAEKLASELQTLPSSAPELRFEKKMQAYRWLSEKVLKTQKERDLWKSLLQDLEVQKSAIDSLRAGTKEELRMDSIDYLADSMRLQKELNLRDLAVQIQTFLKDEAWSIGVSRETLKSLAGDRVELFITLAENEPALASELKKTKTTLANERVMQYAAQSLKGKI